MKNFAVTMICILTIQAQQEYLTFVEGFGNPVQPILSALGNFNERAHAYYSQLVLQDKVVGDTTKLLYKHTAMNETKYIGIETQARSSRSNPQIRTFIVSDDLQQVLNVLQIQEEEINQNNRNLDNLSSDLQNGFNCQINPSLQMFNQSPAQDCYRANQPDLQRNNQSFQNYQQPCPQVPQQQPTTYRPVQITYRQAPPQRYTPQRPVIVQPRNRPQQNVRQPQQPQYYRPQRPVIKPVPVVVQTIQPVQVQQETLPVNVQGRIYQINCNTLRYPTNLQASFYKNNVLTRNYRTPFTQGEEESKRIFYQIYSKCQEQRNNTTDGAQITNENRDANNNQSVSTNPPNQNNNSSSENNNSNSQTTIEETNNRTTTIINANSQPQNRTSSNSDNSSTTRTITTTTRTISEPETIEIGNFSLEEFDQLLSLFERSPEAIGLLNVDSLQGQGNQQSSQQSVTTTQINRQTTNTGNTRTLNLTSNTLPQQSNGNQQSSGQSTRTTTVRRQTSNSGDSNVLGNIDLQLVDPVVTSNTQTLVTTTSTDSQGNVTRNTQSSGPRPLTAEEQQQLIQDVNRINLGTSQLENQDIVIEIDSVDTNNN